MRTRLNSFQERLAIEYNLDHELVGNHPIHNEDDFQATSEYLNKRAEEDVNATTALMIIIGLNRFAIIAMTENEVTREQIERLPLFGRPEDAGVVLTYLMVMSTDPAYTLDRIHGLTAREIATILRDDGKENSPPRRRPEDTELLTRVEEVETATGLFTDSSRHNRVVFR